LEATRNESEVDDESQVLTGHRYRPAELENSNEHWSRFLITQERIKEAAQDVNSSKWFQPKHPKKKRVFFLKKNARNIDDDNKENIPPTGSNQETCYGCRKPGHLIRECKETPNRRRTLTQNDKKTERLAKKIQGLDTKTRNALLNWFKKEGFQINDKTLLPPEQKSYATLSI